MRALFVTTATPRSAALDFGQLDQPQGNSLSESACSTSPHVGSVHLASLF